MPITGTGMAPEAAATPQLVAKPASVLSRFFSPENRYLSPLLLTTILLVGQLSFGLLESFKQTALAIVISLALEALLGRLIYGKIPNLASAYISGISCGILTRSPAYWPFALVGAISILSKYVIRIKGRHLWNPSNFAICAMLLLAPEVYSTLSVQWGNNQWPLLIVWSLGAFIMYRVRLFHITLTYVTSFLAFAVLRSMILDQPFQAEIAPLTGPMYQLFIFFMITDPKTAVKPKWAQCLVAFLIASMETILRLAQVVHAPFFALTIVGPTSFAFYSWWTMRKQRQALIVN